MTETFEISSAHLNRNVRIDVYRTERDNDGEFSAADLLLVNDGQDLSAMNFESILKTSLENKATKPLIVAAIYCGDERQQEYGMSIGPDYQGWGSRAGEYENFVTKELMPFLRDYFGNQLSGENAIAGFSLGGLSAFDIAWRHPFLFRRVAVFSGSFWWRSVDKNDKKYDPWKHRMMHYEVAHSGFREGMEFFFECGERDEEEDRNHNGVIDSIDDTIDLMRLLIQKGYREGRDIYYLQMEDGRHDVASWARALPVFLKWMNRKREKLVDVRREK